MLKNQIRAASDGACGVFSNRCRKSGDGGATNSTKTEPNQADLSKQLPPEQVARGFPSPNQAELVPFDEHLRRTTARVIVRRLAHPISPSDPDCQNAAGFDALQRPITQKTVSRLA